MLPVLGTRIETDEPRAGLTRRQLLVRGGLAAGGLIVAGFVIRAASLFNQAPGAGLKALSSREVAILTALIEAALPGDDVLPAGDPSFIVPYADDYLAHADPDIRLLVKSMLQVVEEQSLLFSFSRFSRSPLAARIAEVQAWERTPIFLKRAAFASVKMVLGMAYFEQPGTSEAIGWYVGCAPPHLIEKSKDRLITGTS